jgi:hypothetical protein
VRRPAPTETARVASPLVGSEGDDAAEASPLAGSGEDGAAASPLVAPATPSLGRLFIATTDSDHNGPIFPNLAKNIVATNLNQLWVAEITYIAIDRVRLSRRDPRRLVHEDT